MPPATKKALFSLTAASDDLKTEYYVQLHAPRRLIGDKKSAAHTVFSLKDVHYVILIDISNTVKRETRKVPFSENAAAANTPGITRGKKGRKFGRKIHSHGGLSLAPLRGRGPI